MERNTIKTDNLRTLCWSGDNLVDWASGGKQYSIDGKGNKDSGCYFAYNFDSAISSFNNEYAFLYQKLGTKGLLIKNGELLREINRSYYLAEVYEYPAAFITNNGNTYLAHCPLAYNRLDFENVETGELITNVPGREPSDVFHSRLEINQGNTFLLNKGWVWHPLSINAVYNISDCIKNPSLLDKSPWGIDLGVEICTANFISNSKILIGSSDEIIDTDNYKMSVNAVAVWNLETNDVLNPVAVNTEFGNLFAINDRFAWDTFKYPKIIDIQTGEVVDQDDTIDSGTQNSSIINASQLMPRTAFNTETKQLAIGDKEKIEVLTPDISFINAH